jgi:hypothetical protein
MATFKVSRELISERELIERAFCDGYEYAQREFGIKDFFTKKIKGKVRAAYHKGAKAGIERGYQRGLENATMKDAFKNLTKAQKIALISGGVGLSGLAAKGALDLSEGK